MDNVVPLRPRAPGPAAGFATIVPTATLTMPAGSVTLPSELGASIIEDYQASASLWRMLFFVATGVAAWEYWRYVRPARASGGARRAYESGGRSANRFGFGGRPGRGGRSGAARPFGATLDADFVR